jgi:prophage antirepressor-like protein
MSQLLPFQFDAKEVRVVLHEDGTPWWVLTDVCKVLGILNPSDVARRLESTEYAALDSIYSDNLSRMLIINESGLYRTIFRSDKPDAKRFQDWVFTEVLPQIRKTGSYTSAPPVPPELPSADAQLETIRKASDLLDYLGHLTERDTLMLADQARNVMLSGSRLLSSGQTPAAHGFSVAERVEQLGYHLTRKQAATFHVVLGKMIAKEYRNRYGVEPLKEARYVDGATRQVSWFAHEDADWVDPILQGYLAGMLA